MKKNPFDIQDFCFVNHSKRTFIIVKKRKSTIPTRETGHPTGQTDNFRLILIPFPSQILPVLTGNFTGIFQSTIFGIIRSTLKGEDEFKTLIILFLTHLCFFVKKSCHSHFRKVTFISAIHQFHQKHF